MCGGKAALLFFLRRRQKAPAEAAAEKNPPAFGQGGGRSGISAFTCCGLFSANLGYIKNLAGQLFLIG